MNAGISDIDARTMFTLKGWNIVRTSSSKKMCFAVHTECKPPYGNVPTGSYHPIRRNFCYRCGDVVPDELQALVILHHWGAS